MAIGFFVAWMLFFDQRDVFTDWRQKQELKVLKEKKHYYEQEIAQAKQELSDLQSNPDALEKFARERYKMKKDGEDVFIIDSVASIKK